MYLTEFYSNAIPAANDENFVIINVFKQVTHAIDQAMLRGDWDFAEQLVSEGVWTTGMAVDYLYTKTVGHIDLCNQSLLTQSLFDNIRLHFLC